MPHARILTHIVWENYNRKEGKGQLFLYDIPSMPKLSKIFWNIVSDQDYAILAALILLLLIIGRARWIW